MNCRQLLVRAFNTNSATCASISRHVCKYVSTRVQVCVDACASMCRYVCKYVSTRVRIYIVPVDCTPMIQFLLHDDGKLLYNYKIYT